MAYKPLFNFEFSILIEIKMNKISSKTSAFNLEERTALFAEQTIQFYRAIYKENHLKSCLDQLIRSATSIGANYTEANGASSIRDFTNKISICKKEARESLYWFRLIGRTLLDSQAKLQCRKLWKEAYELVLIFSAISHKLKKSFKQ